MCLRGSRNGRSSHYAAFTLLELLIVLAIIAVLISLLLPALNYAREQARWVNCKSNLQQINNALRMYANDFRDRYPDAQTTGNFAYRMAPGRRTANDPGALPEVYGLAAVLHGVKPGDNLWQSLPKPVYISGRSNVWVCAGASDYLRSTGSTYAFSIAGGLAQWTSGDRSKRADNLVVWENYTLHPGLSGFRGPFGSYSIPSASRVYPHRFRKQGKGAVIELYLGGYVDIRIIN